MLRIEPKRCPVCHQLPDAVYGLHEGKLLLWKIRCEDISALQPSYEQAVAEWNETVELLKWQKGEAA